ncbi:hypothetical protein Esti_000723 [Eimeria stiedai]
MHASPLRLFLLRGAPLDAGGPLGDPRLFRLRSLKPSACPGCTYTAANRRSSDAAFTRQWESNPVPAGVWGALDGSRKGDAPLLHDSAAAGHAAGWCTDTSRLLRGPPPLSPAGAPCAIQGFSKSLGRWLRARGAPGLWTGSRAGGPRWAHTRAPQKGEAAEAQTETLVPAKTPEGPLTLTEAEALQLRAQTEQGLRLPVLPWVCFGALLAAPLALAHYHATRLQQRQQSSQHGIELPVAVCDLSWGSGSRSKQEQAFREAEAPHVFLLHPEAFHGEPGAQEVLELEGAGMLKQLARHRAAQTLLGYIHAIRPAAHHLLKEVQELDLAAAELLQCEFAEAFVDAYAHTPRKPTPHAEGSPPCIAGAAAGQQRGAPPLAPGGGPQQMQSHQKPALTGVGAAQRQQQQQQQQQLQQQQHLSHCHGEVPQVSVVTALRKALRYGRLEREKVAELLLLLLLLLLALLLLLLLLLLAACVGEASLPL